MNNDKLLEAYMRAYLYELETKLNKNSQILATVKFQQDEANTDKEIKAVLKSFILNHCTKITLIDNVEIDEVRYEINKDCFSIKEALIPGLDYDLNNDIIHRIAASTNSVFVNPDLVLKCFFWGKEVYQKIELKSTKNNNIPGSSVQQVLPDEWVIFIQHKDGGSIKTITGKYKNSISGTMQFPDRSPRPQISYNELNKWLHEYRAVIDKTLVFKKDNDDNEKTELLTNWQGILSKRWLKVLLSNKKSNEPWFNNNLRKFAIELLDYYDKLSDSEKTLFKENIVRNIEADNNED